MKYLLAFENDMTDFVRKVKFDKVESNFQKTIKRRLQNNKMSIKTLTAVDKTFNWCRLAKD